MIVNNIFSRILFGILASCCLLACRGELPVLPSDEIEVGKDPLGGVHIKVGSINSIFYFLHKAAEPFNCLEQDNLA